MREGALWNDDETKRPRLATENTERNPLIEPQFLLFSQ